VPVLLLFCPITQALPCDSMLCWLVASLQHDKLRRCRPSGLLTRLTYKFGNKAFRPYVITYHQWQPNSYPKFCFGWGCAYVELGEMCYSKIQSFNQMVIYSSQMVTKRQFAGTSLHSGSEKPSTRLSSKVVLLDTTRHFTELVLLQMS